MAATVPRNSPSRKALNIQRNTSDSGKLKADLDEVDISTASLDKDFFDFTSLGVKMLSFVDCHQRLTLY